MLDKQLKAVNRTGAAARYSTPELTLDEASFGGDGNGDENTPNTGTMNMLVKSCVLTSDPACHRTVLRGIIQIRWKDFSD